MNEMRADDLLNERDEFMRELAFDQTEPPTIPDNDPITVWGRGLCRLSWADGMTGTLDTLRQHIRASTNPMRLLSDMGRLPSRFGALWTNRNRDLHDAVLRDMFRMVMERTDVGTDVRSMCLTYLLQHREEDARALLETAWDWLQQTNDPNLIDIVWTHQVDLPIIREWLDARRFVAPPATEIMHRTATPPPDTILNDNIYTDSQSVHTSTITQDFHTSLALLHSEDNDNDNDAYDYAASAMVDDGRLFNDRILHDPTVFRPDHNTTLRLIDIFGIVHRAALRYDALDRLVEELTEAEGTCSSGHAFRMVNSLVGIHPGVMMRIGIPSQVRVYLQEAVRSLATNDGLLWFEGAEFHAWVARRLPDLVRCFRRHDRIGGRQTWLSEWSRLFPTCTINPFTLLSLTIRYPIAHILRLFRP